MTDIKPGLHFNMPNEDYHEQSEWLSSTTLKRSLPEHYKDTTDWSSPALAFGTLVHKLVLEPNDLDHYAVLDATKIGLKADGTPADNPQMTKAWKVAVAAAAAEGREVVAQEDWDKAHRMADAVRAHDEARELLFEGEGDYELSAFVEDENGIKLRSRFDRLIPGAGVDLKTTSAKPGPDSLTRAVLDYGYEVSAAHYLAVAELLGLNADRFVLVFVDKSDAPRVTVAHLDQSLIDRGKHLRDKAIQRLISPDVDRYPGATGSLTLTCPPWARLTAQPTTISPDFTWSIHDYA